MLIDWKGRERSPEPVTKIHGLEQIMIRNLSTIDWTPISSTLEYFHRLPPPYLYSLQQLALGFSMSTRCTSIKRFCGGHQSPKRSCNHEASMASFRVLRDIARHGLASPLMPRHGGVEASQRQQDVPNPVLAPHVQGSSSLFRPQQ